MRIESEDPKDVEELVGQGYNLMDSDPQSAERILSIAVRLGDPSGRAAYCLGQIARARKDPALAKRWFRKALRATPDHNVIVFLLAQAHDNLGETKQARALLKKLLKMYPAHEGGKKLLAKIDADAVTP